MAIEQDLLSLFSLIPGGSTATAKLNEFEDLIKSKAKEGAIAATPDIEAAIAPYVYASLAAGVGGLLMGLAAIIMVRKQRRSS